VGLDPRQIEEIRQLIRELGQSHSVILSTHILSEVQAVCSHVQIINQGELVLHSTLADLSATLAGRHYHASFQASPNITQLGQLPGVDEATVAANGCFLIDFNDQIIGIESLLQASLDQGWGLKELTPPQASLEQLFLQLTDQPGHDTAAEIPDPAHIPDLAEQIPQ